MKLKNLFFAMLTLVCVTSVPAMAQENAEATTSSQQSTLMLTLDDALKIALSESPTVQIADQTIQAKKYAKKGTYAALWPEISASASEYASRKKRLTTARKNLTVIDSSATLSRISESSS